MFGLDYISGPSIDALKTANVGFVCRYLSEVNNLTEVKLLKPDEATALSQAGIAIVGNYEWYASRALEGFNAGVQDAQIANAQHAACGGPGDRPIYFSVDQDVEGSQVGDYFRGVASVIGLSRTGAYGSYRVIKYLFDQSLITWGWQTYAWSYGQWEPRAHIQQYLNGQNIGGASVDFNRSIKADFGQWFQSSERTTWVSTYQEQQARDTWYSTTQGTIGLGGNAPVAVGLFPVGQTPNYDTGIAQAWKTEYMNGHNWGPPMSYEYAQVNGSTLTDWDGKGIIQQNFMGGRCEWQNAQPHWYAWGTK